MSVEFDVLREVEGVAVARSPWGPGDELGRLNWLREEPLARVLREVDPGRVFDLTVAHGPDMARVRPFEEETFSIRPVRRTAPATGRYPVHADVVSFLVHAGTHVDALQHMGYCGQFWNGHDAQEHLLCAGGTPTPGDKFPPVLARGVLLDLPGLQGVDRLPDTHAISADEVRACAAAEGVELRRGDVVCVRTGKLADYPTDAYASLPLPGITLDAAEYLCRDVGALCVGADTISLEAHTDGSASPVHAYMFCTAGTPIVEILDLDALAAERVHEFAFLGFPLKLEGATGSPLRAVALPLAR